MIIEQTNKLRDELLTLESDNKDALESLKQKIQSYLDISANFGKNWLGEWGADSYNYYDNFLQPRKGGYFAPSKEDIIEYLDGETKSKLADLSAEVFKILDVHQTFQQTITTELSIIRGNVKYQNEESLLDSIEDYQWGITPKDYIKPYKPQSIITRKPEKVLNKGLPTPPHFLVDGELVTLFSIIAAIEDFQKTTKRLLRQIELKSNPSVGDQNTETENTKNIHNIIDRFHIVANQLLYRHDSRVTIEIKDEYDVQDLLHALLKLDFDDVRPEEYTPSYGGSSTRVDFLLKHEKIVIEVKKTRKGLDDREVGNQLMLDALHYKAHPDCKHLICFVYDPENRIKNPRGLETDLNKLSNDELLVELYIRP